MRKLFTAALALAPFFAAPAFSQETSTVTFRPGDYGTMVSGQITGDAYRDYVLGANAGQELFAELTVAGGNGSGTAYFNILPPGSAAEAIFNGSMTDGKSTRLELPESGDYTIRVYLLGNDKDAGKTVAYNLDLSIQ
ncbi:hypothetical protein [Jiella marina]|uniref:hypothetical protein n=1 Tax=Jiella sp. LLJ827 TaxID=2917712 RepID=UPI002101290B|nr:hypothetical protein [Jiella sp. LLJ827]MCQ0987856.1 hypothetical protein [Jiella sp. LLJ827]